MLAEIYRHYAESGFHLAAQPAGEKFGLGHKPGDFSHTALDAKGAVNWIEKMGGNVSVTAIEKCAFLDFDVDPIRDREKLLLGVKMALGATNAWRHRTPRGGMHLLVKVETDTVVEGTQIITFPSGQMDVKGFGRGYVVGPGSKTEDGDYVGYIGSKLPVLDDKALPRLLLALNGRLKPALKFGDRPAAPYQASGIEPEIGELEHYLSFISADICQQDWLRVVFGSRDHYRNGLSQPAFYAIKRWSATSNKYKDGEVERLWRSGSSSSGRVASFGSVVQLALDSGAPLWGRSNRPVYKIPPGKWGEEND